MHLGSFFTFFTCFLFLSFFYPSFLPFLSFLFFSFFLSPFFPLLSSLLPLKWDRVGTPCGRLAGARIPFSSLFSFKLPYLGVAR